MGGMTLYFRPRDQLSSNFGLGGNERGTTFAIKKRKLKWEVVPSEKCRKDKKCSMLKILDIIFWWDKEAISYLGQFRVSFPGIAGEGGGVLGAVRGLFYLSFLFQTLRRNNFKVMACLATYRKTKLSGRKSGRREAWNISRGFFVDPAEIKTSAGRNGSSIEKCRSIKTHPECVRNGSTHERTVHQRKGGPLFDLQVAVHSLFPELFISCFRYLPFNLDKENAHKLLREKDVE